MSDPFITLILFAFLLIGIYLIYNSVNKGTCTPVIQYKYLPRTFQEEQLEPIKVSDIFSDMFTKDSIRLRG